MLRLDDLFWRAGNLSPCSAPLRFRRLHALAARPRPHIKLPLRLRWDEFHQISGQLWTLLRLMISDIPSPQATSHDWTVRGLSNGVQLQGFYTLNKLLGSLRSSFRAML